MILCFDAGSSSDEKVVTNWGNGYFDIYQEARPMGVVKGVDQFADQSSDSNSEVSAAESVGTNRTNSRTGKTRNGINDQKINITFIDFLRVGAS